MVVEWLLLGLVVLLIGVQAFFVMAEFSLVTTDRGAVRRAVADGDPKARSVDRALQTLSTQLSGCQLGITLSSLIVGLIAEPSIATLLRTPLHAAGLSESLALPVSVTAAFVLATFSQMVLGELVPKNWAIAEPLRLARWVSAPQVAFSTISKPLLMLSNGTANLVLRAVGVEPQEELASARSPQELGALALRSADEGTLQENLARHVYHSAEFGERHADDAMTPRAQVHFLKADDPASEVLQATSSSGYSRFPVAGSDDDEIVGAVHFKHVLAVDPARRDDLRVCDVMVPATQVPSSMPLDNVLQELREGLQFAVVVDEYGGTDGIITLEDLVEELVGEIEDEHDRPQLTSEQVDERSWQVSGLLRPDEVTRVSGLILPEPEDSETLGGLITERLERFPEPGDEVTFEALDRSNPDDDGIPITVQVRLLVERMDGPRVDLVLLQATEAEEES